MNKKTNISFILLILFTLTTLNIQSQSIIEVRKLLEETEKDKSNSIVYAQKFAKSSNPVILGYAAMFYFLHADYLLNPFSKLKYFNKGKQILDSCINAHPKIIELRLLRYAVQKEIPAVLSYNNMYEDKILLKNALNNNTIDDKYLTEKIKETLHND